VNDIVAALELPPLQGRPDPARRPAPKLGEHTDEILASLGLAAAEIAGLRARGVA
jgi:crotonobetainyl-CoA:carnitine CoA-transferase CaiB-like acyl-CoA transferase